ncbi:Nuclear transcription factor Y subunit [Arachis hypogaea]|nr:Nuclear transcription factor Y subunit [Arachis hypogaea]
MIQNYKILKNEMKFILGNLIIHGYISFISCSFLSRYVQNILTWINFMDSSQLMHLKFWGHIMLPLNLTSDDGPTYVNAKQYHRQSRAKAVLANKLIKRRKPYMHESCHLHAMRRPRECGGRFLNTRNSATNNGNGKIGSEANKKALGQQLHSSGSQSSEVLQSSAGSLNSLKETNGSSSNISSEVTSMYSSRGGIDRFAINHIGTPMQSLADMMDTGHGHGMIMPRNGFRLRPETAATLMFDLARILSEFWCSIAPKSSYPCQARWKMLFSFLVLRQLILGSIIFSINLKSMLL